MTSAAARAGDDPPRLLPRGRHPLSREEVQASQRERLLDAMVELAASKGYHAVTIGDIVERAGTSRRVFYELFADKEDCFLATFSQVVDGLLASIAALFDPTLDQAERAAIVIDGFVDYLSAHPSAARTYFVEVNGIIPAGVERAQGVRRDIADMLVDLRRKVRRRQPGTPPLTQMHALAVVGAIHEVVGQELLRHGPHRLRQRRDQLVALAVALLGVPPPAVAAAQPRRVSR